jgi:PIN domain nuclease of toxin-antitoxin system
VIVVDASAILAAILGETGGDRIFDHLDDALVSSVNVAEVYTYAAVNSLPVSAIDAFFTETGINVVAFDHAQAVLAGQLADVTRKSGLSLGDRSCLALAKLQTAEVLTADRAWQRFADALGLTITLLR